MFYFLRKPLYDTIWLYAKLKSPVLLDTWLEYPLILYKYNTYTHFLNLRLDTDTLDTFRAICAAEEISERALALTQTVIEMSPSHYTIW